MIELICYVPLTTFLCIGIVGVMLHSTALYQKPVFWNTLLYLNCFRLLLVMPNMINLKLYQKFVGISQIVLWNIFVVVLYYRWKMFERWWHAILLLDVLIYFSYNTWRICGKVSSIYFLTDCFHLTLYSEVLRLDIIFIIFFFTNYNTSVWLFYSNIVLVKYNLSCYGETVAQ